MCDKLMEELEVLKEVSRLASAFMMSHPREMYFQLDGRLVGMGWRNEVVRKYLDRIVECSDQPHVRAVNKCLSAAGGIVRRILWLESAVRCVEELGSDGIIACGCADGRVVLLEMMTETIVGEWKAHVDGLNSIAVTKDERKIVPRSGDRTVRVWSSVGGKELMAFRVYLNGVLCLAIGGDEEVVVSGGAEGLKVWDMETGSLPVLD